MTMAGAPPPPRRHVTKEAVVMAAGAAEPALAACVASRLLSLLLSSGSRHVWLLDHPAHPLSLPGFFAELGLRRHAQPRPSAGGGWSSFDDDRTGGSKAAFILWLARRQEYEAAWLIEPDVFYTGHCCRGRKGGTTAPANRVPHCPHKACSWQARGTASSTRCRPSLLPRAPT